MSAQPNSRKHILGSTGKSRSDKEEEEDSLYHVRRVQAISTRELAPSPTRMRLRSMTKQGVESPGIGEIPHPRGKGWSQSYRGRLITVCIMLTIGGALAFRPVVVKNLWTVFSRARSSPLPPVLPLVYPEVPYTPPDTAMSLKLQRDYELLKHQHEQSAYELKLLQEKIHEFETAQKMEANAHTQQEADELRVLNRQISMLTRELNELRQKYGEVEQGLVISSDRNARVEAEISMKIDQIKSELESELHNIGPKNHAMPTEVKEITPVTELEGPAPNLATFQNGARIVKRFTTTGLADEEYWSFWIGKAAASLFPSGRYQPLMGVQTHPAEIVLDERPIRGPGDCFCVKGTEANLTVDLGLPIYVSAVTVEHAPRQLETHIDRAPWKFTVFAQRSETAPNALSEMARLETSSKNPSEMIKMFEFHYPEERTHTEEIESLRAQRFRFHVQARPGASAVCVYRIGITGNVIEH